MAWEEIDADRNTADEAHDVAKLYRLVDNTIANWQKRGRFASICFDPRDPVDLGSIAYRGFWLPSLEILPGCATLTIRVRYKASDSAGVNMRFRILDGTSATDDSQTAEVLRNTTSWLNIEVTGLDVRGWLETHDPLVDRLELAMMLESQATGTTYQVELAGPPDGVELPLDLSDFNTVTSGSLGALGCCGLVFKNTNKGTTLDVGGDHQTTFFYSTSDEAIAGIWPPLPTANRTPAVTAGEYRIGPDFADEVELVEYARIQIAAISIEQVMDTGSTVRSLGRAPLIADQSAQQEALQSLYPVRAPSHRRIYQEQQRQFAVHTPIYSMGPGRGTVGKDLSTSSSNWERGRWPGHNVLFFDNTDGDGDEQMLFGCRLNPQTEFRGPRDTGTRVRRAVRVRGRLLFLGGTNDMRWAVRGAIYEGTDTSVTYTSTTLAALNVSAVHPPTLITENDPRALPVYCFSLPNNTHDDTSGPTNQHRRCNLAGMWDRPDLALDVVTEFDFTVMDPDSGNNDPERLVVTLAKGDTIFDDYAALNYGEVRVVVLGWCVTGLHSEVIAELGT